MTGSLTDRQQQFRPEHPIVRRRPGGETHRNGNREADTGTNRVRVRVTESEKRREHRDWSDRRGIEIRHVHVHMCNRLTGPTQAAKNPFLQSWVLGAEFQECHQGPHLPSCSKWDPQTRTRGSSPWEL